MLPSLTDSFALLGVDLVVCAVLLRLLSDSRCPSVLVRVGLTAVFLLLCLPVGPAHLPVAAYIRGVSSDLSVTLVGLCLVGLCQRLSGRTMIARYEVSTVFFVVVPAAVVLYTTALGWGDLDAYRLGWGSPVMLAGLFAVCIVSWQVKFRLLPLLIAASLLAWSVGLLESSNLWDYLIDPWLGAGAVVHCMWAGAVKWRHRGNVLPGDAVVSGWKR